MRRFTELYLALDASTRTSAKVAALVAYFRDAPPADAGWAAWFLTGRRFKRLVGTRDMAAAALTASGLPEWLFRASYDAVGDFAETIALVTPPPSRRGDGTLAHWVEHELAPLAGLPAPDVQARLVDAWDRLAHDERFVFGKLLTGEFRVGAAKQLVLRALAEVGGIPVTDVAHRMVGEWTPSELFWEWLRGAGAADTAAAHRPYPFFLAHPLETDPAALGDIAQWQAEWKWDGIRAQLVVRDDGTSVWSRGEELVSAAFPEVVEAAKSLAPGTVLDGELLAWTEGDVAPLPFAALQKRLNRKTAGAKLRRDVPVVMAVYDLLEQDGIDIRSEPLAVRRARLERLLPREPTLKLSPTIVADDWPALERLRTQSRERRAEGLMLKRRDAPYGVGRVRGPWWKWKVDPYTIDAVLVYAQAGHGRRASLYTDYTFAVWNEQGELVPFAKAYSGLDDAEIHAVDRWIRAHTLEKFGPVRQVVPSLVFELAFEGVQRSTRHKSGVAVRFPRIARWRREKPAAEADTLATLQALALAHVGSPAAAPPPDL
jgi:ATP-dependent DNA ligase